MKPSRYAFLPLLALLISPMACVKKNASKDSQSQCEAKEGYAWLNNKCLSKTSLSALEAECANKGDDFIWLNNICQSKSMVTAPKTACEARQDGSLWHIDPETGVGNCVGPTRTVSAKEECEKQATFKWDEKYQQCLNPQAQACNDGGDVWVDGHCLSQEINQQRELCVGRRDGSEWIGMRCVTLQERQCGEKGYHFIWKDVAGGPGQCHSKGLLEYCLDQNAPADIKLTLTALMDLPSVAAADCQAAADMVAGKSSMTLSSRHLTSLVPLAGLSKIQILDLSDNSLVNLEPLQGLSQLRILRLLNNQVSDLAPLKNLRYLEELYLGGNQVVDLAPLAGLPSLKKLYLNNNKIVDVTPLAQIDANLQGGLSKLIHLSLDHNCGLTNANPLQKFSQLTRLFLKNTGVNKDTLPAFASTTEVHVSNCP